MSINFSNESSKPTLGKPQDPGSNFGPKISSPLVTTNRDVLSRFVKLTPAKAGGEENFTVQELSPEEIKRNEWLDLLHNKLHEITITTELPGNELLFLRVNALLKVYDLFNTAILNENSNMSVEEFTVRLSDILHTDNLDQAIRYLNIINEGKRINDVIGEKIEDYDNYVENRGDKLIFNDSALDSNNNTLPDLFNKFAIPSDSDIFATLSEMLLVFNGRYQNMGNWKLREFLLEGQITLMSKGINKLKSEILKSIRGLVNPDAKEDSPYGYHTYLLHLEDAESIGLFLGLLDVYTDSESENEDVKLNEFEKRQISIVLMIKYLKLGDKLFPPETINKLKRLNLWKDLDSETIKQLTPIQRKLLELGLVSKIDGDDSTGELTIAKAIKRRSNEDVVDRGKRFILLADGISEGGLGMIASNACINRLHPIMEDFPESFDNEESLHIYLDTFYNKLALVDDEVSEITKRLGGTTLVLAKEIMVNGEKKLFWLSMGDSRLYKYNIGSGKLDQISTDDSAIMVKETLSNKITQEEEIAIQSILDDYEGQDIDWIKDRLRESGVVDLSDPNLDFKLNNLWFLVRQQWDVRNVIPYSIGHDEFRKVFTNSKYGIQRHSGIVDVGENDIFFAASDAIHDNFTRVKLLKVLDDYFTAHDENVKQTPSDLASILVLLSLEIQQNYFWSDDERSKLDDTSVAVLFPSLQKSQVSQTQLIWN